MSTPSSNRSTSVASSSLSPCASVHSLSSIDGDNLYELACVETFSPLSTDITPEEEPTASFQPVTRADCSPNFKFIYGLYRALRSKVEYVDAVAQQRRGDHTVQIIRAVHTSPARWLLLLAFALRQCTSNYTVWKDRRDVIMSPDVLRYTTRDQLHSHALPALEDGRKKVARVAQHWLPGTSDLFWTNNSNHTAAEASPSGVSKSVSPPASAQPSLWRAVHWELNTVGCFTRLYHKNFQVWHHRRELVSYALQQTTFVSAPPIKHVGLNYSNSATAAAVEPLTESVPPLLESEETFSAYLEQNHGLHFADVDERTIVKAVLCDRDSKNYHAWLHLSWYLHALPFLLLPPSWAALKAFTKEKKEAQTTTGQKFWVFRVHPEWVSGPSAECNSSLCASRLPTLPLSPLTSEMDFTAQLIQEDCLNNSAWCHRYSLFKEDLLHRLWQEQRLPHFELGGDDALASDAEFRNVVYTLCMVEVNFALQWLYVDPTNESAYTHARSIAMLFHTVVVRLAVLRGVKGNAEKTETTISANAQSTSEMSDFLRYLRDAPLCPPVAAANRGLCASAEDGSVSSSTPVRNAILRRMQYPHLSWSDYDDSFAIVRHVQQVLHTSIRQRVSEVEGEVARVLRTAAEVASSSSSASATATAQRKVLLDTLYERSSQYMLDNLHQVRTAQYLLCQGVLEEMWMLYLNKVQRRAIHLSRTPENYREGIKPGWISALPWENEDTTTEETEESDAVVACFLRYEAAALDLAKRLSIQDAIRFKYWKFETMTTMQRDYGFLA